MTTTFEPGRTYEMRWVTDSTLRTPVTVIARTAKFITVSIDGDAPKRVGVRVWAGVEKASPEGRYSMSPVLSADRPVAA